MGVLAGVLGRLFRTQKELTEADTDRATRAVVLDGICSTSMATLQGGVFLTAFALSIGASNYEIGLLATIMFFSQLLQLPGLYLVNRFRRRRGIIVLCAAGSRLLWVFIILIPLVFIDRGMTFMLQWIAISACLGALAGPSWNSLLKDTIPEERMGKIFSKRMMIGMVLAIVFTLGGGYFVDWWQVQSPETGRYAYAVLFALGLLFGLAGVFSIATMPEPEMLPSEATPILLQLGRPFKDKNYRGLLSFICVWNFAVNLAGPFFMIYMLRRIGISLFLVTILTVASQVANVLFLRIWGRIADQFSNKSVLAVCCPMFLLAILGWIFTTMPEKYVLTIPLLFVIHIFSGISMAGINLGSANIALKLAPTAQSHVYMTAFAMAGAVAGMVAPALGGVFADFFAVRAMSIDITWAEPTRTFSMYAINLKALDFLFALAFIAGLFAVHRLAFVKEEGEVGERQVIDELINEVAAPVRSISAIAGVRRLPVISIMTSLAVERLQRNRTKDTEGTVSKDVAEKE